MKQHLIDCKKKIRPVLNMIGFKKPDRYRNLFSYNYESIYYEVEFIDRYYSKRRQFVLSYLEKKSELKRHTTYNADEFLIILKNKFPEQLKSVIRKEKINHFLSINK